MDGLLAEARTPLSYDTSSTRGARLLRLELAFNREQHGDGFV